LKKKIEKNTTPEPKLPLFRLEGTPQPEPIEILKNKEKSVKRRAKRELLAQ